MNSKLILKHLFLASPNYQAVKENTSYFTLFSSFYTLAQFTNNPRNDVEIVIYRTYAGSEIFRVSTLFAARPQETLH
jgi:hypothetical protein